MKEQGKTKPTRKTKRRGDRQSVWERKQSNDSRGYPRPQRMEAWIEKTQEKFNKDLEELKNQQTEMNNAITEMEIL